MTSMNTEKSIIIKYPDTLIELWQYMRWEKAENEKPYIDDEDQRIGSIYLKLTTLLANAVKNISPEYSLDQAQQDASDFLSDLLQKPYGEIQAKTQFSYLVRDLRKQIAKKENPSGYELSQIIRKAIRELEDCKEVIRDDNSKERNISQLTSFKLVTSPDREASFLDYEANVDKVSKFTTEIRKGDIGNSRIITPKNARQLIRELLAVFNGWISWGILFKTILRHIPEDSCFHLETLQESSDGLSIEEQIDRININNNSKEDDTTKSDEEAAMDFYEEKAIEIIHNKSAQIWDMICKKAETKFFCLYHIPKHYGEDNDFKPVLKDFGSPQTMSDMDKRISEIFRSEMTMIPGIRGVSRINGFQRKAVSYILSSIFAQLYRRCTENGYNPHLSAFESKEATN